MDINIIGVPLFYGCDKLGVQNGPNVLRENGLISILNKYNSNNIFDLGNLIVQNVSDHDKYKNDKKMKYLSPIIDINNNLAHAVYTSLKSECFPFVVGGDHALGIGSIAGASKHFKDDLAVIWIDAHGDINTNETSPTGNIHGMPLAASMNIGPDSLTNIYFKGIKVNPEKVFIFGARDLDCGELELINRENLNVWTTDTIKSKGVESVLAEFLQKLKHLNVNNIHLSFDIDSLDSNLVPGTGTPVDDGMSISEVTSILKSIFATKKVRSMDFVEFNPQIDKQNVTLNSCLTILKTVSSLI